MNHDDSWAFYRDDRRLSGEAIGGGGGDDGADAAGGAGDGDDGNKHLLNVKRNFEL